MAALTAISWKRAVSRGIAEIYSLARAGQPAAGLRILLYHAVGTRLPSDPYGISIAPERFRKQMAALVRYPQVNTIALEPGWSTPANAMEVAITFDDGFRDTWTIAAPILHALSLPFSVFIVPQYVTTGQPAYLTMAELRRLADVPGCSIGSHGMTHRRLATLNDQDVDQELRDSRRWIEQVVQRPVTTVSYPHGSVDQRVRDAAARAGYQLGVCSHHDLNRPGRDPLLLCRTEILGHDRVRVFEQKLLGGWDWRRLRHPDPQTV